MGNCRICQDSVPRYQSFCSRCGARQIFTTTRGSARRNVLSRLKDFFSEASRSEAKKRFYAATELGQFGPEEAIPGMEEALELEPQNPEFKSMLGVFYATAGTERIRGVCEKLGQRGMVLAEGGLQLFAPHKPDLILSAVRGMMESESFIAHKALDKAFGGALEMFDKSLDIDPNYPRGYSGRASAYEQVAEGILMAYGIFPVHFLTHSTNEAEYELVQYGDAQLGMCIKRLMPSLEFLTEIIWLYEQAEEEYKEALRLDPTDTTSCVGLSHVLGQLGKRNEANDYIDKALAILNKAILANNEDKRSYSERADILKDLGKIELAISDLEQLLTLSTQKFEIDSTRRKIEELRKGKEAGGRQSDGVLG